MSAKTWAWTMVGALVASVSLNAYQRANQPASPAQLDLESARAEAPCGMATADLEALRLTPEQLQEIAGCCVD